MKVITLLCTTLLFAGVNVAADAAGPKADNTAQNRGATEKNAVTAEKQKSDKDQCLPR